MPASLLELFRLLSSFSPSGSLPSAPWEEYVDWAIAEGLAPLAAYNLEYRLGGGGAPEWARDRLLSVYQGSLNDNVMKLVNFKRSVDELEGVRAIVLGGASFAESLYPHVAFRPVLDIDLLVREEDADRIAAHLAQSQFKPVPKEKQDAADRVLSDGRTRVLLYSGILGEHRAAEERALFERAQPMRVYGPSIFRVPLEDAILVEVFGHAASGYEVPTVFWVDFRELVTGATATSGVYSHPPDVKVVLERAKAWKLDRALYASASIAARLFPEAQGAASALTPALPLPTRAVLDAGVVEPVSSLGKLRHLRGTEQLRRLLSGG